MRAHAIVKVKRGGAREREREGEDGGRDDGGEERENCDLLTGPSIA